MRAFAALQIPQARRSIYGDPACARFSNLRFCGCSFLILVLLLAVSSAHADLQLVWRIGVDDDPLASGYNATGEFSQENGINDPRPGKVTRVPGDPLYNATNNP